MKRLSLQRVVLIAMLVFPALLFGQNQLPNVSGEIPSPPVFRQFHYQGCLTKPNGDRYNGTFKVMFELIDLDTSPFQVLFSETVDQLTVNNGIFEHAIGSVDTVRNPLNPLIFQKRVALRLTVDGETLRPPIPIYPSPIAMVALYADSLKQPLPPGPAGADGINCWDLNGNGKKDPGEDKNGDGKWDANDCQGPPGPKGPAGPAGPRGAKGAPGANGINCWDLNGNGKKDPGEDKNGDGKWDAKDCQGPKGDPGSIKDTVRKLIVDTLIVRRTSDHYGWEHYRDGISVGGDNPTSQSTTITRDGVRARQIVLGTGLDNNAIIDSTGEAYLRSLHIVIGDPLDPKKRKEIISFNGKESIHKVTEKYISGTDTTYIYGDGISTSNIGIWDPVRQRPSGLIREDGEAFLHSLHIVDSTNPSQQILGFDQLGSYHFKPEVFFDSLVIPLENGNVIVIDPIEGFTIKSPKGKWVFHISPFGDLLVTGNKNNIVKTASYGTRKMYAVESPEVWYVDRGQGQLVNGQVRIPLDPMYLETVTVDARHPMIVKITPTAECNGMFVAEKGTDYFVVKELMGGSSNATFDWEVSIKRKGYEDVRLEPYGEAATREEMERQSNRRNTELKERKRHHDADLNSSPRWRK